MEKNFHVSWHLGASFLIGYGCGDLINVMCNVKYDLNIGFGILFCFCGIMITLFFDTKTNKEKIRFREPIKAEKGKRLPFYTTNKIVIFCQVMPVFLLLFMLIGQQYILFNFSVYTFRVTLINALPILLITLLITLALLFEKGGLLNFEKEISSKFNIIETEKKKLKIKNKKELPSECLPASRITYTKYRCKYIYYEYMKMYYENSVANLGLIGYGKHISSLRNRYYKYECLPYEPNIFISLELPYKFRKATYIGYTANVDEVITDLEEFKNNLIELKYNNIPHIFYTDKEYAENILTESVQKKLSDLARCVGKFNIEFLENKITFVIQDSKWSTFFSEVFNKKRNARNILKVAETVLTSLKEISDEIEKNDAY